MNRPRKSTRKHWPDYLNARNKPAGLYYSWKHQHTAHGIDTLALLGHDDESSAKAYSDPRQGLVEVKIPVLAR